MGNSLGNPFSIEIDAMYLSSTADDSARDSVRLAQEQLQSW